MAERAMHAAAWLALAVALGVHVVDEAVNDFLAVYNPAVTAIRERVPLLPLPVFSFRVWIAGLTAAVLALMLATPAVLRGSRASVIASWVLAVFMTLNAFGHFAGSIYLGRLMPGVISSPLLLAAALFLGVSVFRLRRSPR